VLSLLRSTRGAHLVEYLLIVGLVAIVALAGVRVFGDSANRKAEAYAECVQSLGCKGRAKTGKAALVEGVTPPPPAKGDAAKPAPKPPTRSEALDIASRIVRAGGSGTKEDAAIVAQELAKLPVNVLSWIEQKGITVVAAKGSVTDYLTHLKGVRPRGWPPGSTWDTVPGLANGKEVVIAVRNGRVPPTGDGHGAFSLVIHETFHAIDNAGSGLSKTPDFVAARTADAAALDPYLSQAGEAGQQETFAESAARFFGGDPKLKKAQPGLYKYWETHRDTLFPPKPKS
jgi:Flp pilus assembly pilin Flp